MMGYIHVINEEGLTKESYEKKENIITAEVRVFAQDNEKIYKVHQSHRDANYTDWES